MNIAFFDLDGTLLDGDTDVLWGELLSRHGVFDAETTEAFQRDYSSGDLDAEDFVARFLSPIKEHGHEACLTWLKELLEEHIYPSFRDEVLERLEQHRSFGHALVLATATNEFLTEPIAAHLKIPHLLASPAERVDGRYTGRPNGPACFRREKLNYATEWLAARETNWESANTWFYSDSVNDLPLLEAAGTPTAIQPDDLLREIALARGWEIISG